MIEPFTTRSPDGKRTIACKGNEEIAVTEGPTTKRLVVHPHGRRDEAVRSNVA